MAWGPGGVEMGPLFQNLGLKAAAAAEVTAAVRYLPCTCVTKAGLTLTVSIV